MKDALVIPAQGDPYKAEIPENKELEELQRIVGGWIEYVPVHNNDEVGLSLFCNEEGKLQGLPVNLRATHYFSFALREDDVLVGDVILMGPPDEKGDTLQLEDVDEWIEEMKDVTDVDLKRWADFADLRARKKLATTDEERAALAIEEEALRDRGIDELMEKDMSKPESWWWLSFADPNKDPGEQFLGVIITTGGGIGEITQKLWLMGINPGGEVQAYPLPDDHIPDEQYRNKLLSKDDLEEAGLA